MVANKIMPLIKSHSSRTNYNLMYPAGFQCNFKK